ncbi:MAG TPA: amino acid ABC transporter permease [Clostridia bacterium]|nr:amino acid ABC transporter permease [Clostridia bacterium]
MEVFVKLVDKYGEVFLQGLYYTLLLSLIAVAAGTVLGALVALARMSRIRPLKWLTSGYIELIRGTPALLQLFFFYLILPKWLSSINPSKFACVAVALVINSAAYVSEIIRSGIQAVDRGQAEAGRSLGLSKRQTMLRVVMPQAVKNILPALGNEFVTVIKETSLASTFFVGDLMSAFRTVQGATYLVIEPLVVVGVIYLVLTYTLSKAVLRFERRLKASD